jgi:hypothetical protein
LDPADTVVRVSEITRDELTGRERIEKRTQGSVLEIEMPAIRSPG